MTEFAVEGSWLLDFGVCNTVWSPGSYHRVCILVRTTEYAFRGPLVHVHFGVTVQYIVCVVILDQTKHVTEQ